MEPLTLAFDVGPLYGHRTGVAVATEHLLAGLRSRPEITVLPYLLSARATPRPGHVRLPLPAAAALRLWAHIDHPRVDRWLPGAEILHGTNYVAPPSRLPQVISVYDCWFLMHPEAASPAVNRSAAVLRRAVAAGAHLHVSSAATAAVAGELLATDRITVIHLGPPALGPAPAPAQHVDPRISDLSGSRLILAIGTIERRKDIPSLVTAFGMIAADLADVRLVIAGTPGDDQARAEAAITALPSPIRSRVHLLGAVTPATKAALLEASCVLAYPSRDEGFGFPILEAQQVGLAVVARPSGSIPEVGGSGVQLACDQTTSSLADALAAVLTDDVLRASVIRSGTMNLTRFSWDRCVNEMLDLYRQMK
jgi:glycosyltransferase involved in cell wall biosynthesis